MTSLRPGDAAPDFELDTDSGTRFRLSAHRGRPVVLFFFPIASSPICTAQACHFRDLSSEFATVGAHRVGIRDLNRKYGKRGKIRIVAEVIPVDAGQTMLG